MTVAHRVIKLFVGNAIFRNVFFCIRRQLALLDDYSHPEMLPEDLYEIFDVENNQAYVMMATKRTGEC
jgi:hypothetical protein